MISPRTGPRRARLASLLAALALAVGLAATPADPAAAEEAQPARITLSDATIKGSTLTLTGTLTNAGSDPLDRIQVALWRSPELLLSPDAVTTALAAPTTTAGTARVVQNTNRDRITFDGEVLSPGQSRAFTVSGSLDALGLRHADATWWVGVDATARVENRGTRAVGAARTLVSTAEAPLPVVTVVELSAPPRQLKKDLFLDDGLRADIDGGRLDSLLSAIEAGGTSWVIDPALVTELEDMADGYRVQTTDGSEAGTGADAAAAWLSRYQSLPHEAGALGLFGSPDLAGLVALPDETVPRSIAATTALGTEPGLATVALLDHADAAGLALASQLANDVVLLDSDAPAVHVQIGAIDAIAVRTTQPSAPTSGVLADTDLTRRATREAVARASGGEVRWVRTPDNLPAPGERLPPLLRRGNLADVRALPARAWTPPPAHTPAVTALDAARLGRVLELRNRMTAYADAAPASGVGEFVDAQVARAASRWWTGDAQAQATWLTGIERRVALPDGDMVALDASPRFSMTGSTSEFPVTVTNRLMDPVTVRLAADTDNPQRIRLLEPNPVEIAPGASSTVLLTAESAGGGVVRARVHVQTPDGHRLTPDREIAVETTNYGTVGWIIVIVSGLVLVVTTAHRIRQVRGQRKGEDG